MRIPRWTSRWTYHHSAGTVAKNYEATGVNRSTTWHGCPRCGLARGAWVAHSCLAASNTPLEALLREFVDTSPWSASYDDDWCHFCCGDPSYGPKPWRGHSADCLWIRASQALGRDVANLIKAEVAE